MSLGSAVSRRAQQWSGNVAFSSDDNGYKKESFQQEIIMYIISTAACNECMRSCFGRMRALSHNQKDNKSIRGSRGRYFLLHRWPAGFDGLFPQ